MPLGSPILYIYITILLVYLFNLNFYKKVKSVCNIINIFVRSSCIRKPPIDVLAILHLKHDIILITK